MTTTTGAKKSSPKAKRQSIPATIHEVEAAAFMTELITALETLRQQFRDAHDACEVGGEAVLEHCRDAGTWPGGWDKIPESRRWRKLMFEAAADCADASKAVDTLVTRAQRVLGDLNRRSKKRQKFDASR
jgi:hypothetical protein